MITADIRAFIASTVAKSVAHAIERLPLTSLRPGTVASINPSTAVATVQLDGDSATLAPCQILDPAPLLVGDRVMVLLVPPRGAFVAFHIGYNAWNQAAAIGLMPWLVDINVFHDSINSTGLTLFAEAGQLMGGVAYNTSTNLNDYVEYYVALSAGTWQLMLLTRKAPDAAIITVYLDGVAQPQTMDCYNATVQQNQRMNSPGIIVPYSGLHSLVLYAGSKSTSSSDYVMPLGHIQLMRTA